MTTSTKNNCAPEEKLFFFKKREITKFHNCEIILSNSLWFICAGEKVLRISVVIELIPQLLLFLHVESEIPRIPSIFPSSNTAVDVGRRCTEQTDILAKV